MKSSNSIKFICDTLGRLEGIPPVCKGYYFCAESDALRGPTTFENAKNECRKVFFNRFQKELTDKLLYAYYQTLLLKLGSHLATRAVVKNDSLRSTEVFWTGALALKFISIFPLFQLFMIEIELL